MSKLKSFQEISREEWRTDEHAQIREVLQIGALLRIAEATEKIAADYDQLKNDYDYMRSNRNTYRRLYRQEYRSNRALRGWITRLKKKLKG